MCTNDNKLHLVYASDSNYVLYLEVAIHAAYVKASRPEDLIVHVLDCGISDKQWADLVKRIETAEPAAHLERHDIDMSRFDGLPGWTNNSRAIYARICLPSILQTVEWCLYADCDTLFIADPLDLLACRDPSVGIVGYRCPMARENNFLNPWYAEYAPELLERDDYVCSGLLLMNLGWCRKNDIETKLLTFMAEHPEAPYPDQDAINVVCMKHIMPLPDGWGTYGFLSWQYRPNFYKCIHYTKPRPWKPQFIWRVGYLDMVALWVYAAQAMLDRTACLEVVVGTRVFMVIGLRTPCRLHVSYNRRAFRALSPSLLHTHGTQTFPFFLFLASRIDGLIVFKPTSIIHTLI